MSKTKFVEYRGDGFWAYDVSLRIFLKHLIDASTPHIATLEGEWLDEAISSWRVVAAVADYGLEIDATLTARQIDTFINLADRACNVLAERDVIAADEISSWPILDDLRIHTRGATKVLTAPVVELGRAIIALVNGSLPPAPKGTAWLYGTPEGRDTIRVGE